MKIHIAPTIHARAVTLKARVDKLDDLYWEYFMSGEYIPKRGERILTAKTKCLKHMGIILGVCI